jgi:hypothetical protein
MPPRMICRSCVDRPITVQQIRQTTRMRECRWKIGVFRNFTYVVSRDPRLSYAPARGPASPPSVSMRRRAVAGNGLDSNDFADRCLRSSYTCPTTNTAGGRVSPDDEALHREGDASALIEESVCNAGHSRTRSGVALRPPAPHRTLNNANHDPTLSREWPAMWFHDLEYSSA